MNAANESSPAPSLRRLPFLIRLSPPFVNRVSAVMTSGENAGGVTGLLFGVIETDFALVQSFRSFPPRSASTSRPGSRLTIQDLFDQLVAASGKDPELAGLSLLGWYSARSVSGLQAEDVEFHQKFFGKPNDLALIVKPEEPGEVSLELYSRTLDGVLSNEGHRWGSVRISSDSPVSSPVEVPMRAKIHDDFYMRAYQFADPFTEEDPSPRWKDAFASTTKRAFELLKTVRPEDRASAGAPSAKREPKDPESSKLESLRSVDPTAYPGPHAVGTGRGAAAAPARVASQRTVDPQPFESKNVTQSPEEAKPENGEAKPPLQPPAPATDREQPRLSPVAAQPQLPAPPASAPGALALTSAQSSLPVPSPHLHSSNLPARAPQYATRKDREVPWLAMTAVFAVTAGATFGFISLRSAHANGTLPGFLDALWPAPGLGLKLSNEGDRVQLSWNQDNAAVRTAGEAILEIYDGVDHRQVRLTARELASGSVLYRPNTDDVVFHLEVHGAQGQTASQTMRVLGTSKPAILDVSQPKSSGQTSPDARPRQENTRIAPGQLQLDGKNNIDPSRLVPIKPKSDKGQTQSARTLPKPAAVEQAAPTTQLPANNTPAVTSPPAEAPSTEAKETAGSSSPNTGTPNTTPPKEAVAENVPPPTPLPSRETPAPQLPSNPNNSAANTSTPNTVPSVQQPETEAPVNVPALSGQASQPAAQLPSSETNSGRQALASYIAPRPLRQVMPNVKALPAGLGDTSGDVKVLVKVNESGRVIDAKIVEGSKTVNSLVRNAAILAAKQWTFEPASLRGRKIASDHTILFQFHH